MPLCKVLGLDCSFLTRLLLVAVLPLALVIASIASPRAQQVFGAPGEPGADCFTDGCFAGNGTDGESVTGVDAFGGAGGAGGNAEGNFGFGGNGGNGGAATGVNAFGGPGGAAGNFPDLPGGGAAGGGGNGGDAFASGGSSVTAVGGAGGIPIQGQGSGGGGGNATATSSAFANGTGDATASATATGGVGGGPFGGPNGNATATSSAFANGTGDATASATATGGAGAAGDPNGNATATAYAETANGGLAQAQASTDVGTSTSIAKTSFGGVSVQSTASTAQVPLFGATVIAIAQGGTGQPLDIPFGFSGFSIALPDKADASTLIGGASNVADALLGPDDKIFGAAILNGSSTFNFSFQGDLILGVITGGFFDILANGTDILSENIGDDSVINLGSTFGPNIDLTIEGFGSSFALGGAVPEPSTWAMMLLGFVGLAFAGRAKAGHASRPTALSAD
jgi:PEP-CTERM motif